MTEKVCETYVGNANKAVTDVPTLVYWVFFYTKKALDTHGAISIRDGFSTSDKEITKIDEHGGMIPFNPPLRCAAGLYIDINSDVSTYTVGYIKECNLKD